MAMLALQYFVCASKKMPWKAVPRLLVPALLALSIGQAAELQGVIADWKCTEAMVRDGREKTLKQNRDCSLMKNPDRASYGLITVDKNYYQFDESGNQKVRELLRNTPDKDNLKVIVSGDLDGNTIKVTNISML
jgi:hypothetical protein